MAEDRHFSPPFYVAVGECGHEEVEEKWVNANPPTSNMRTLQDKDSSKPNYAFVKYKEVICKKCHKKLQERNILCGGK